MTGDGLLETVRLKIGQSDPPAGRWGQLVEAACVGEAALERALAGVTATDGKAIETPTRGGSVYLRSLSVEGFRGIGELQTLRVQPGPGLTLVIGRNGSGKSSFAEAAELLLTGENRRWSERSLVWKDGWRNLHHPNKTEIRADFVIEGHPGGTTVEREWLADVALDKGVATFQHHGRPRESLKAAGWEHPLELYRPFLSYNELSAMFNEGPTAMYDHLSEMLGLEDLVVGAKLLAKQRLNRKNASDAVRAQAADLLVTLGAVDDDRAGPVWNWSRRSHGILMRYGRSPWGVAVARREMSRSCDVSRG